MCGRYRRTTAEEEIARQYHIPIPPQLDLPISYNIAPTQNVLAIRLNPKTDEWSMSTLRWGLIPSWAKDEKIGYKTINARVETVDTSPSYREAYKKRRCLIPADGFYEWKRTDSIKQPYSIQRQDGTVFCFAGLWEGWKKPGTEDWIRTCTIITCEPNELNAQIHNRMPVILPEEHFQGWLSGAAGKEVLAPYPDDLMSAYAISPRVNKPENNDAEILRAETNGSGENYNLF
jgi:putative SOS response-associated peptidase YedK